MADSHFAVFNSVIAADYSNGIVSSGTFHIHPFLNMPKGNHKSGAVSSRSGFKVLVLIFSIPVFVIFFEIFFTLVPIDTFFENRFFLLNRALDYPEVFKRDRNLFWRLRPSQTITSRFFENNMFKINSAGLRGDEIEPKGNKIRIIGLGNSCTFGWRTPEKEIYLRRLEQYINSDSLLPKVEIINAGIPGYSSYQGMIFFKSEILNLKPDVILLMFGWNDQWAASDNIPDKDIEFPPQLLLDLHDFIARLRIYRFMRKVILSATEKSLDESLNKMNPVYRVSFDDFYKNLQSIALSARKYKIPVIILTSPIPSLKTYYPPGSKSNMHTFHEAYNQQARKLAKNLDLGLVDLAQAFDEYDDLFDDARNDPIHFNAKGHQIAADLIYYYFREHPEFLTNKNFR